MHKIGLIIRGKKKRENKKTQDKIQGLFRLNILLIGILFEKCLNFEESLQREA